MNIKLGAVVYFYHFSGSIGYFFLQELCGYKADPIARSWLYIKPDGLIIDAKDLLIFSRFFNQRCGINIFYITGFTA